LINGVIYLVGKPVVFAGNISELVGPPGHPGRVGPPGLQGVPVCTNKYFHVSLIIAGRVR